MTRPLLLATAAVAAAACGGGRGTTTIAGHGGAGPRGPALVYLDWGQDAVFEADCWAPDAGGCDAARAKAQAGGVLVAGGARFTLGATRDEECGASGDVAKVVGYTRAAGPADATPGIAVFPADAAVDLRPQHDSPGAPAWIAPLLVPLAAADLVGSDRARPIAPGEIQVTQVVEANVAGGPQPDLLIAAGVPLGDSDGPGYVWSALVLIPDGDRGAAVSLWHSDLEALSIGATYDLDGDGVSAFIWTASYYEGASTGAAHIAGGKLVIGATVGCGA